MTLFLFKKINVKYYQVIKNSSRVNPSRPVHLKIDIKIKINLNFYFHTSLWCLKRFYKGVKSLRKTFWGNAKKCENKKF